MNSCEGGFHTLHNHFHCIRSNKIFLMSNRIAPTVHLLWVDGQSFFRRAPSVHALAPWCLYSTMNCYSIWIVKRFWSFCLTHLIYTIWETNFQKKPNCKNKVSFKVNYPHCWLWLQTLYCRKMSANVNKPMIYTLQWPSDCRMYWHIK